MTTVASTGETAATPRKPAAPATETAHRRKRFSPGRVVLYVFLTVVSLGWLSPILLLIWASLRPYQDTQLHGYFSWPHGLTLKYYGRAWSQGDMAHSFLNSLFIAIPGVILTLFLASFLAFALTRVKIPFRKTLLILFTAGNLLPPQMMVTPLFEGYIKIPMPEWVSDSLSLYDSYLGVILIHVAFQTGFCVFVLYNYMLTIPIELTEASIVDGASVWRQYWQVILPVSRPAIGALATLEFTWIYNDFLWALVLMSTGNKYPVTSSLNNLRGTFFVDFNLLAAGAMIVALPTLIVFFALQRQFISGLTLGAAKG
jgi:multiple sugar transport system permease protein